jgi:hypothetical protein
MANYKRKSYTRNHGEISLMSYLAVQKLREKPRSDPRRKLRKVGKPRNEGGHERLNISLSKPTREYLQKIENMSHYVETLIVLDATLSGRASGHFMFFQNGAFRKVPEWQIHGLTKGILQKIDVKH